MLDVKLINESDGKFECALYDEEGNEKHKIVIELSYEDLQDMTEDIIFSDKITQDALYRDLKEEIVRLIIEKSGKFSEDINYEHLSRYDSMAAGDIASKFSGWIEQRVYEYLNNVYSLNNEQLEEVKKFYQEGIDLNLVIEGKDGNSFLGSKIKSAEEMKDIRISKEEQWKKRMSNNFKNDIKFDGNIVVPGDKKYDDGTNIGRNTGREEI